MREATALEWNLMESWGENCVCVTKVYCATAAQRLGTSTCRIPGYLYRPVSTLCASTYIQKRAHAWFTAHMDGPQSALLRTCERQGASLIRIQTQLLHMLVFPAHHSPLPIHVVSDAYALRANLLFRTFHNKTQYMYVNRVPSPPGPRAYLSIPNPIRHRTVPYVLLIFPPNHVRTHTHGHRHT